ncbi:hypothetical protein BS78_02G115600 [Paspalum vaginatum]|nr:hypothetical protein BS78_02G115600 [Paspalum vaginatum]
MAPPTTRARDRGAHAASSAGVLSLDTLFLVLLCLPAKEICRLRVICRSWRSLTFDPLFVKEHAARHPGPLLLAKFRDDEEHVHVVDLLSGNVVVKRLAGAGDHHQLLCTNLDLACLVTKCNSCRVLSPATGAIYTLPKYPALGDPNRADIYKPATAFAFGRAPSTGEYKVLRMFNRRHLHGEHRRQLFDVCTINGGTSNNAQWRAQSRDIFVDAGSAVAVGGAVYFLMHGTYYPFKRPDAVLTRNPPDHIASFDIEREEWRRGLRGPISGSLDMDNHDDRNEYSGLRHQLTLAELKGSLVIANCSHFRSIMDIWFLTDFENGLWVKEYSIKTELIKGRLIIYVVLGATGQLLICDPQANTSTEVEMGHLDSIGIYTGNLLSLQRGW